MKYEQREWRVFRCVASGAEWWQAIEEEEEEKMSGGSAITLKLPSKGFRNEVPAVELSLEGYPELLVGQVVILPFSRIVTESLGRIFCEAAGGEELLTSPGEILWQS